MDNIDLKIELNTHYKPYECVLMCGDRAYHSLPADINSTVHKVSNTSYVCWKVWAKRKNERSLHYVKIYNGTATIISSVAKATSFMTYEEAREIADTLIESSLFCKVAVMEILYDVEESY